jgi:Uma2 family endonuclease
MAAVLPQRHLITINEWQKMVAANAFSPENRIELINGEILEMPPIGFNHAGHVNRMTNVFAFLVVEKKAIISVQNPLQLGDLSEPQPDFMLLRLEENCYTTRHPQPEDVLLLVEVADSSLSYDRERKQRLYAMFGIPEYWLINLNNESLEVYRQLSDESYAQKLTLYHGETLALSQLEGVVVNTATILNKKSKS